MAIIDKVQGTIEKLTGDDTRINAAEVTAIQQAFNSLQLGLVKTEFYLTQVQAPDVRNVLTELRDEFVKPNLDKPRRILEKAGIPLLDLNVQQRIANVPQGGPKFFSDQEVLLDTVLAMQAHITGLQAGALVAVRGDVRDYFLNARDSAMDQWRKIGLAAMRLMPQSIPPTLTGTGPR